MRLDNEKKMQQLLADVCSFMHICVHNIVHMILFFIFFLLFLG